MDNQHPSPSSSSSQSSLSSPSSSSSPSSPSSLLQDTPTPSSQSDLITFISPTPTNVDELIDMKENVDSDELHPSSQPSSSMQNKENTDDDPGIIIAVVISSCILLLIIILMIVKYRKNKIMDNNLPNISLKNKAAETKPHKLNISQMSSKTDDTLINSPHSSHPHPPLPKNTASTKSQNLPNLPDVEDIETGNNH